MTLPSSFGQSLRSVRLWAIGLLMLAWLIPGKHGTWFDGLPLSSFWELIAILILISIVLIAPLKSGTWRGWSIIGIGAAIVIGLKIAIVLLAAPSGLRLSMVVPSSIGGIPETYLSANAIIEEGKRVDLLGPIDLRSGATSFNHQTVPIGFLNNEERYNAEGDGKPFRWAIPWNMHLGGYLQLATNEKITLFLTSSNLATLAFDGRTISSERFQEVGMPVSLSSGFYPIAIDVAHEVPHPTFLTLSWQVGSRQKTIVPLESLHPLPLSPSALQQDRVSAIASLIIAALLGFLLLFLVIKGINDSDPKSNGRRSFLLLFIAAFVGLSLMIWMRGMEGDFRILQAGNDPLFYESNARTLIEKNDFLLRGPEPGPYYYNVLYQYVLALGHLAVGPDLALISLFQLFGLFLTAIVYGLISQRLFNRGFLPVFFVIIGSEVLFGYTIQFFPIGSLLLGSAFLAALTFRNQLWGFALCGILMGLLLLMRTNFIVIVPLLILWFAWNVPWKEKLLKNAIFLVALLIIVAPATIRNVVVSGKPVLINTNFSNNLYNGNPIPATIDLSKTNHPIYNALQINPSIRGIMEYIKQDPGSFWRLQLEKTKAFLGITPIGIGWWLIGPMLLAIAWLLWPAKRTRPAGSALLLWSALLMSVSIVLSIPWSNRYALPILTILLVFAAEAITRFLPSSKKPWVWLISLVVMMLIWKNLEITFFFGLLSSFFILFARNQISHDANPS